jgi:S-DNA-T family DNA segregation ATPase FtsK/SpoIIIE
MAERVFQPYFGHISSHVVGLLLALVGLLLATDFLFIQMLIYAQKGMVAAARGGFLVMVTFMGMAGAWQRWRTKRRLRKSLTKMSANPEENLFAGQDEGESLEDDPFSPAPVQEAKAQPAKYEGRRKTRHSEPPRSLTGLSVIFDTPDGAPEAFDEICAELPPAPAPKPLSSLVPIIPQNAELAFDDDAFSSVPLPPATSVVFDDDDEDGFGDSMSALIEAAAGPSVEEIVSKQRQQPTANPVEPPVSKAPPASRTPAAPAEPAPAPVIRTGIEDAAKTAKTPARPRRRTTDSDDLPEDYVYPKYYTQPSLDLFEPPRPRVIPNLTERLRDVSDLLEQTLRTFNIEARVTDVRRGPTVTRFEVEPAPGTKVARFIALTDDIALALEARGVRVEAPIPGKARVGIEVSNEIRDPVVLRELLENKSFRDGQPAQLNLALGKGIDGSVCIADLTRMPHLLVAGATGAGKTVCVKSLLASLLVQHTPDELQLMLIDPKMVELSIFNDIPHLITPVVTDAKKAASALTWLITEMEERYRLFADLRIRNIELYNKSVENGAIEMVGEGEEHGASYNVVRRLPYIVCVIDELADLMILARVEVEQAIARLAQLARAVGIHLIIATQRPSVDVITGVIKANFPARISFQVSCRVDSRCILDEIGAERLVGMGDMLYLPAGQSKPDRVQGAFVSDTEMSDLVYYLKRQAPPQYRDEIENFGKSKDQLADLADDDDPLFEDAVHVVLETGQASISMVQRRLRVGYTRAARLVDMMELRGIVGPSLGSKVREILVDSPPRDEVA